MQGAKTVPEGVKDNFTLDNKKTAGFHRRFAAEEVQLNLWVVSLPGGNPQNLRGQDR